MNMTVETHLKEIVRQTETPPDAISRDFRVQNDFVSVTLLNKGRPFNMQQHMRHHFNLNGDWETKTPEMTEEEQEELSGRGWRKEARWVVEDVVIQQSSKKEQE